LSERFGPCPNCGGRGKKETLVARKVLAEVSSDLFEHDDHDEIQRVVTHQESWVIRECGRCMGTGHSGEARQ